MDNTIVLQQIGPGVPGFDPARVVPEPAIGVLFIIGLLICLFRWRKQFRSRNVPVRISDLYR